MGEEREKPGLLDELCAVRTESLEEAVLVSAASEEALQSTVGWNFLFFFILAPVGIRSVNPT